MGANDGSGERIDEMQEEFGVDRERAVQITNRVRKVAAEPDCNTFEDAGILGDSFYQVSASNLIESLAEEEGETLESW